MVFRRRYSRKRFGRKRSYRRKFRGWGRRSHKHKVNQGTIYYFKRKADCGMMSSSISPTLTSYGIGFALNGTIGIFPASTGSSLVAGVSSYGDFTGLFDQYKICGVKMDFIPQFNVGSQVDAQLPQEIMTVIDYDDTNPILNINNVLQYQNCKVHNPYKRFSRYFRPHNAMPAFTSTGFNAYANVKPQWIDSANAGALYFGLKIVLPPTTGVFQWRVVSTFYIKCKNVL